MLLLLVLGKLNSTKLNKQNQPTCRDKIGDERSTHPSRNISRNSRELTIIPQTTRIPLPVQNPISIWEPKQCTYLFKKVPVIPQKITIQMLLTSTLILSSPPPKAKKKRVLTKMNPSLHPARKKHLQQPQFSVGTGHSTWACKRKLLKLRCLTRVVFCRTKHWERVVVVKSQKLFMIEVGGI